MPSRTHNARRQVEALRLALLTPSPEEVWLCLPGLEEAVRCLTATEQESPNTAELRALKSDLRIVTRLIEHGAALHQGWARLLGAVTAGYTATGDAAPVAAFGSLSIVG